MLNEIFLENNLFLSYLINLKHIDIVKIKIIIFVYYKFICYNIYSLCNSFKFVGR